MKICKIILLFVCGGILGSLCDLFHVSNYITGYRSPYILAQAWWVPLIFGTATLAIALSHVYFDQIFKRPKYNLKWTKVLYGIIAFIFMYFISAYWPASSHSKIILLAFAATTIWYIFDKTVGGLVYAIITAIIGSAVEISLVQSGAFHYTQPEFYGIVYWLPFLYIAGSVVVGNVGRVMFEGEKMTNCTCKCDD